ncbi:MAG: ribonuclease P protein component [Pseudomonadota bacterium]
MARPLPTIRKRADFLRARSGPKWGSPAFLLQKRPRGDDDPAVRFGYTVTKKMGGAVQRNRIKRRLRAAVALAAPLKAEAGCDYVVVARRAALTLPFARLLDDFETALVRLARPRPAPETGAPPKF